jgi:poly-gamma-glutamate synthesis protein (capsule biosynthesis protein)
MQPQPRRTRTWLALVGAALVLNGACPSPAQEPRTVRRPAAAHGEEVVLAFVGDVWVGGKARKIIRRDGEEALFGGVSPAWERADLRLGNLESAITTRREKAFDKRWSYRMPPRIAPLLRSQGFDVLGLANNHTLDYGHEALEETLRLSEDSGLSTLGAGATEADARRGLIVDFDGGPKVGLLAYMQGYRGLKSSGWFAEGDAPGLALASKANLRQDIRRLRERADVIVVQLHFGLNYKPITRVQEGLARAAVRAGADLVIGHHPHIVQAMEVYRGKPILYSVGNFIFSTPGRFGSFRQPGFGLVALCSIDAGGVRAMELRGLLVDNRVVDYRPRLLSADEVSEGLLPILAERGVMLERQEAALWWRPKSP